MEKNNSLRKSIRKITRCVFCILDDVFVVVAFIILGPVLIVIWGVLKVWRINQDNKTLTDEERMETKEQMELRERTCIRFNNQDK